ncbi:3-isopropylmalate dehydratase large subunit [bacterium]|nr:3-isopropylmalate dehydratase large subunit [bacterium]
MTLTEKIISQKVGREVHADEIVMARVDLVLANDITAPLAIKEFQKMGAKRVFDGQRIVFIPDHYTPCKDVQSAENVRLMREFAKEQDIIFYEIGRGGIEHTLLPDEGLVLPGDLVVGADSHTCTYGAITAFATGVGSTDAAFAMAFGEIWLRVPRTMRFVYKGYLRPWVGGKDLILYTIGKIGVEGARYKAMEFTGEVISRLTMADRFTMTNMAIEAGAKTGLIPFDAVTLKYIQPRAQREYKVFELGKADEIIEIDCSQIEPQVACPYSPANVKSVWELTHISINQVVIGSCTNGRLEDLREAARVLKGKKIHPNVRLIVIPATHKIWEDALRDGLLEIFSSAGAVISPPTCGPCLGGHMGVLGKGERAVATTNRNFPGRMGHRESEVYLASPAVAAASAIMGRIAHPEEVL